MAKLIPAEDTPKPFLDHLDDLRTAILRSAGALLVGMILCMWQSPWLLKVLKHPLIVAGANPDTILINLEAGGSIAAWLSISFWGGLLVAIPFVTWNIAWFIFPGLHQHERQAITRSLGAAVLLFVGGVALGYFQAVGYAFKFMFAIGQWLGVPQEQITISSYLGFTIRLLIAFGLTFELPVILYILGVLGVIEVASLAKFRKHAVVGSLIIGMVVTPTQDPFSQLLIAVPLYILYELCIILLRLRARKETLPAVAGDAPPAYKPDAPPYNP
jgi:sec-independent protein translocase protein TatC